LPPIYEVSTLSHGTRVVTTPIPTTQAVAVALFLAVTLRRPAEAPTALRWRDELAPETAARIRADHCKVMREYGYLEG